MASGRTIAEGQRGPVHWAIKGQGPALDFLTDRNRNALIARAMEASGKQWGDVFLPKRFTDYVDRAPFPYPRHRDGFYVSKARRMGILAPVFQRLFGGWDPWSSDKPKLPLIIEWKKLNPGKYNGYDATSRLFNDLRNNCKRRVTEIVLERLSEFMPLVESGLLRKTVLSRVAYRATATSNKQTLRITMPRPTYPAQREKGKFGSSPTVGNVLGTLPHWEVTWFAKKLSANLASALAGRGLSVDLRTGVVTTRTAPTEPQRAA